MSSEQIIFSSNENKSNKLKKKVQCPICENFFSNKSNLKTHISSIHNKILPFKCPYPNCEKKIFLKYSIKCSYKNTYWNKTF